MLIGKDGYAKITDFGLSKEGVEGQALAMSFCGTPEYLAPETLLHAGTGKAGDWWSFGCILYEMMVGVPPFYSQNRHELYESIKHREINFYADEQLAKRGASDEFKDLVTKLLIKDPAKRFGGSDRDAEEIKAHGFFAKSIPNWDDLLSKRYIPPYVPNLDSEEDVRHFDTVSTEMDPFGSYTAPARAEVPRKVSADMWSDFSLDNDNDDFDDH